MSENEEGIWDEDDERKLFMSIITHIKDSRDTRRRFVPPESRPKYPKLAYCKEAMLNYLDCGESDEQREDGREESFTGVSIGNIGGDDSRHGEKVRKVTKEKDRCNWKRISRLVPGRNEMQVIAFFSSLILVIIYTYLFFTYYQCRDKWHRTMNPDGKFGKASKEEDERIMELVMQHGAGNWEAVAQSLGTKRTSRFIASRWRVLADKSDVEKHLMNQKIKQRTTRYVSNRKSARSELKPEDYEVHIEALQ